jgi:hypothetical protein
MKVVHDPTVVLDLKKTLLSVANGAMTAIFLVLIIRDFILEMERKSERKSEKLNCVILVYVLSTTYAIFHSVIMCAGICARDFYDRFFIDTLLSGTVWSLLNYTAITLTVLGFITLSAMLAHLYKHCRRYKYSVSTQDGKLVLVTVDTLEIKCLKD